jgi:LDH2 family malate/lactate/ureidoglycolate dehydrogenase
MNFLWASTMFLDRIGINIHSWWPRVRVSPEELQHQVIAILTAWGMPEIQRNVTAHHILYADLHGFDSHGCAMLKHYHQRLISGKLRIDAKMTVVRNSGTTALMDAGRGLGHYASEMAMQLAIRKCKEFGTATVAVRNSGHFGCAGSYAAMAASEGFIAAVTSNTDEPALVPTGGTRAMLGTNPIAFAAPSRSDRPFLLDMSTSIAPIGVIWNYWKSGNRIPRGWACNARGKSTTHARKAALARHLLPLGGLKKTGGHKGYGLATAVEILAFLLPGRPKWKPGDAPSRTGHVFWVLDPSRFREKGVFESEVDSLMNALRECPPKDPEQPVIVAGDPEHAAAQDRNQNGIPLLRSTFQELKELCTDANIAFILKPLKAPKPPSEPNEP